MKHLSVDIETFSSVDLKSGGLYKYVQSPDFEVLLFAYSFDGAPVQIVDLTQGEQTPDDVLFALIDPSTIKQAYNAAFEWYCLSKHLGSLLSIPAIDWLSQWRCTMLHGLYLGYTAGLAATGEALGLPQDKKKMGQGGALIRTFCVPCKPSRNNGNRTRTRPHHEPEKWRIFKEYCKQDVITEMEIERRLSSFPVPDTEQKLWQIDQYMNAAGVSVDPALISGALEISGTKSKLLMDEALNIFGVNPKSTKQLKAWLEKALDDDNEDEDADPVVIENLQKETVKALVKTTDNNKIIRMLQIRQEINKTSVKKYKALENAVCADGRVRGLIQFYGANRTGRWAGRLVQVHNLPRNYLKTLDVARYFAQKSDMAALELLYGNVPDTLSQLIRTSFVPAPGNKLIVADFSAIEARVIAWLAGEQWRQEVFATHGKIYEASASQMFDIPIERIEKGYPEYSYRSKGKVAELALGYQGSTGALIKMGALRDGLTEDELPELVNAWRQANRNIVNLWYKMENAAISVMETGRPCGVDKGVIFAREFDMKNGQDFLTIQLPSGRKLFYAKPFLSPNQWGKNSLNYYGMDQTTKKWKVLNTYGGKLVENITQAIARDCLAQSIWRLTEVGYHIVFHVHDEVVIDYSGDAYGALLNICAIMGRPIDWAPGLLLRSEGFVSDYYKKE